MKNTVVKLATFLHAGILVWKKACMYLRTLLTYVKSNFFLEVEIEIYTPDKNGSQKLFAAEIT